MCHKRRQLVLSSGLWHPGCDVGDEIPLAKEIEERLEELEVMILHDTAGSRGLFSHMLCQIPLFV